MSIARNLIAQASQQLQTVLGYEADIGHLSEWMKGQRSAIAAFAPPAVTVDTIRAQITEVEVSFCILCTRTCIHVHEHVHEHVHVYTCIYSGTPL